MTVSCDCGRTFQVSVMPVLSGTPRAAAVPPVVSRVGDFGGGDHPGRGAAGTRRPRTPHSGPSAAERILTALAANGAMGQEALFERVAVYVSRRSFLKAKNKLRDAGMIIPSQNTIPGVILWALS